MTKNYLFLFATFFILSGAKAQLLQSGFAPYWIIYDDETNGQKPSAFNFNFKDMTVKSGKRTLRYVYNYDEHGRIVSYREEKSKDKEKNKGFIVRYTSSQQHLKQRLVEFKNNVAYKSDSSVFNKFNYITDYFRYDKNNLIKHQDAYIYDSTLIKEHAVYSYKKGLKKTVAREVYEYESDLQLKKITYYNRKGKAYKKTVFDCNPIGVNRRISKDSAYKCVKYDMDSLGNKMKITIENIKNRSTKVVTYFNNEDKMIAQKKFDLKKNMPTYFVFYHPETGRVIKYIFFYKGKENYRHETTLNDKNSIVEITTYNKNKPTAFLKNEFNNEGLITVSKSYNHKHKLKRTVTYSYALKQ